MAGCITEANLAKGHDQWHYREQSLVGLALTRFCETVKRTSPLLCHVLATAVLVLLIGIVTLSIGSRCPSFRSHGPTWHTSKVSRMHETREETGKAQESEARELVRPEPPRPVVRHKRAVPLTSPPSPDIHFERFRSPPTV